MVHQHCTPGTLLPLSPDAANVLTDYAAFLRDTWGSEAPQTLEAVMTDALQVLRVRYREFARWIDNGHTHEPHVRTLIHEVSGRKKRNSSTVSRRLRAVRTAA